MTSVDADIYPYVHVRQFGAAPGQPDSGPDIRAAIEYAKNNGGRTVHFSAGEYVCGNDGAGSILLLDASVSLSGEEQRTFIRPNGSPSDVTVRVVAAAVGTAYTDGFSVNGLIFGDSSNGQRVGAQGILIDTATNNSQISGLDIANVVVCPGSGNSPGLHLLNDPAHEGVFCSVFEKSVFHDGITAEELGDSVTFRNLTLPSEKLTAVGLNYYSRNGASKTSMHDCNITCPGGALILHRADRFSFYDNNIEKLQVGGGDAVISVLSDYGTITSTYIARNLIGAYNGPLANGAVCISPNTVGTSLDPHNVFYVPTGVNCINDCGSYTDIRKQGFEYLIPAANRIVGTGIGRFDENNHYNVP